MKEMSFEDALKSLEGIVRKLESGDISLKESLELFEKGVALARVCEERLDGAEAKIQILLERNGKTSKEVFSPEDREGQA